eukprot:CAMPEP_0184560012 /NCGR_PEP_ID=MMETSP0199_2-20130426/46721_1 /TAXON_ID=1112570 /ORGANISM="Thraustochytrium sp., Strain LLF1b" /LENGTH=92 /DNA_ID=CAMNT_0026957311 /DNA_START=589 /DNA_END=864 /DNA_ORIENTATION=+
MDPSDHSLRLHTAEEASGQDDRVADSFQDDSAELITALEYYVEASTDSEEKQRRRKLVDLLQGKCSLHGGRARGVKRASVLGALKEDARLPW